MHWISRTSTRAVALVAASALTLLLATGAVAQEETPTSPAPEEETEAQDEALEETSTSPEPEEAEARKEKQEGIEEIIVTARKREEKVQETPISITAFTEGALEERGIGDITELSQYTPNLKFDHTAGAGNTAQIFIRGIGQEDGTINAEQGVGVYIDGVYQTRALGSVIGLHDIQRVEILRGPQGTLFGKNAIGGAVSIITNQPGPEYGFRGLFEAGNLADYKGFLMLNFPIHQDLPWLRDKLFFRGNVVYETRDGYVHDRYLDEDFADHQFLGGRAALRFLPADDLDFTVTYWQSKEDEKNLRGDCRVKDGTDVNPLSEAGADFLASTGPDTFSYRFLGNRSFREECEKSHVYDTSTDTGNNSILDSRKVNGTAIWDLPEIPFLGSVTVKSITAYQSLEQDLNLELDTTALPVLDSTIRDVKHQQYSEELQLIGDAFDDRLDWTLGGFWLRERVTGPPNTTRGYFASADYIDTNLPDFVIQARIADQTHLVHNTYAAYLHADFEAIEDHLNVYGGVRYVHEKKTMDKKRWLWDEDPEDPKDPGMYIEQCFDSPQHVPPYSCTFWSPRGPDDPEYPGEFVGIADNEIYLRADAKTSARVTDEWDAMTGLLGASGRIGEIALPGGLPLIDEMMFYGGYQRGFRSGGYNYIGDDAEGRPNAYDPEYLDGVEFGVKSSWLDRKLRLNLTYFWSYHHDMQQRVKDAREPKVDTEVVVFGDVILNTGDSIIQGGEVELEIRPIDRLKLSAGLGLTFAEYDKFELLNADETKAASEAAGEIVKVYDDLSSNKFQHTPKVNVNLLASYSYPVGNIGELTAQASFFYRSKIHYHVENIDDLSSGKIGVYNARLSFHIDDWDTDIALWCKNLFDRRYLVGGINLAPFGMVSRYYSEPRTYGITLTQRFGGG